MNAFDRYPPSARNARPLDVKPRACAKLSDKIGTHGMAILIGLMLGVWTVIGLAAVKAWPSVHSYFVSSPAASVAMPPATHALSRATVVEAGRRSTLPLENAR